MHIIKLYYFFLKIILNLKGFNGSDRSGDCTLQIKKHSLMQLNINCRKYLYIHFYMSLSTDWNFKYLGHILVFGYT